MAHSRSLESSLICVTTAEGSTNALPVFTVWCCCICLYFCDVERDCSQADGDQPVRGCVTFHVSIHNVLVNKKSNAMLMFILFFRWRKPCVLPLLLFCQSSSVSFHGVQGCFICTFPFCLLVLGFPCSSECPCVPCANGDVVSSRNLHWCNSSLLDTSVLV